jgi:hypothetical protein
MRSSWCDENLIKEVMKDKRGVLGGCYSDSKDECRRMREGEVVEERSLMR